MTEAHENEVLDQVEETQMMDGEPRTSHVESSTVSDAKGRIGVYRGPVTTSSGNAIPNGSDGVMLYHAPPPSHPPPPPPTESPRKSAAAPVAKRETPSRKAGPPRKVSVVKYEGEWWQGHWHGKGKYSLSNGDSYNGAVCFSKNHGKGSMEFSDGRRYSGEWKDNQRQGRGRFTWPGGSYYEGEFKTNKRIGRGKFVNPRQGVMYEGSWEDGVYQGEGIYQWKDGKGLVHSYSGSFVQGKPHGQGREVNLATCEVRHDGLWRDGEPVSNMINLVPKETVIASRVAASSQATSKAPVADRRETAVVNNHTYFDQWGHQIRYRGLWNTVKQQPDGNGTAELVSVPKSKDSRATEEWKSYEGLFLDGLFHGEGRLVLATGDSYEGDFEDGLRHGKGRYKWSDGRQYTGEFCRNRRQGHGLMLYPNGGFYEGSFENGQRHGHGKFMFGSGGAMYEGGWEDGKYHGHGTLVDQDGTTYSGEFADGLQHGFGEEVGSSGETTYKGNWIQGRPEDVEVSTPQGEGKDVSSAASAKQPHKPVAAAQNGQSDNANTKDSKQADDDACIAVVDEMILDAQSNPGHFTGLVSVQTRKPNGVGRLVYEDGKRIHEGFWRNGKKEGHGRCLFFPQGDYHEGEYVDNLRHGPGRYIWKDGRSFEGNYEKDVRQGHGIFTYPSGEKYVGNFEQGRRSGFGRFIFDNGRGSYEGTWKDGKYHGRGTLLWGPGFQYEGEFANGYFHGAGTKRDPNGVVMEDGVWDTGKVVVQEVDEKNISDEVVEEALMKRLAAQQMAEDNDDDVDGGE